MDIIVNGKSAKSQSFDLENNSEFVQSIDSKISVYRVMLRNLDEKNLLLLEYVGITKRDKNRDVDVEESAEYLGLSNAATSIRLRKMRDAEYGNLEIPFLEWTKSGNSFLHRLVHPGILELVQEAMSNRGVSHEKYFKEKGIRSEQNKEDPQSEVCESKNVDEVTEKIKSEDELKSDSEMPQEIDFEPLQAVTIEELLVILNENNKTVINRIVDIVTETFTQIVDEKFNELNSRITEIEKKLSQSSFLKTNQESREELLRRARLLVRQKLFPEMTNNISKSQEQK
ncbi:hypothetical protein [Scytonema sp. NUACC26]|uniref:hypothetical protein n=1 Tax=Scytonema sp. NUACC26 TaxID=3140176 RepID=UPI0034DC3886